MGPRPLIARIASLALFLLLCLPAGAEEQNVQRDLIQRQQQSDEFSQQLRQSVERAKVPPGDVKAQQKLETRQLEERQRLENLDQQQLQRAGQPGTPPAFRPQERSRMQQERQPLVEPPAGEGR
jgi:hypothetical protein